MFFTKQLCIVSIWFSYALLFILEFITLKYFILGLIPLIFFGILIILKEDNANTGNQVEEKSEVVKT